MRSVSRRRSTYRRCRGGPHSHGQRGLQCQGATRHRPTPREVGSQRYARFVFARARLARRSRRFGPIRRRCCSVWIPASATDPQRAPASQSQGSIALLNIGTLSGHRACALRTDHQLLFQIRIVVMHLIRSLPRGLKLVLRHYGGFRGSRRACRGHDHRCTNEAPCLTKDVPIDMFRSTAVDASREKEQAENGIWIAPGPLSACFRWCNPIR